MTSLDGNTIVAQGAANGSQPLLHEHGAEIQAYGTMRRLPLALALVARAESVQLLNQLLADSQILYALYKKHHWLVRGPTFHMLHLLLDTHAAAQLELIDTLAERVQMLGGVAIADPRHVAEVTQIERPPNGVEPVPSMLARLLEAHETMAGRPSPGRRLTPTASEAPGPRFPDQLAPVSLITRFCLQEQLAPVSVINWPPFPLTKTSRTCCSATSCVPWASG